MLFTAIPAAGADVDPILIDKPNFLVQECNEDLFFEVENVKVYMTHIGGYPGHYYTEVRHILEEKHPDIFISGHSHILKVMYDDKLNLLHLNPGAAGNTGFHKKITMMRFTIDGKKIDNLEIFEKDRV